MNLRALVVAPVLALSIVCMPAHAETRLEKSLALQPDGTFVLEADAGSVDLSGSSRSGVHVVATSRRDDLEEQFDFKYEESPGMVRMIVKQKALLPSLDGLHGPNLKIEVPSRTTLDINTRGGHVEVSAIRGDVKLKTSGGHIEVADLHGALLAETSGGQIDLRDIAGDAKVSTSGGHIQVASLKGSLESKTSGGNIQLEDVTGNIDTSTTGGRITIERAGGRVMAGTSGGAVDVSFARGNGRGGVLESSGGSITAAVDPTVGFVLDAETSGGRVNSEITVNAAGERSRSSLRGTIGGGGETLRFRTSAGSINIEPLGGASN